MANYVYNGVILPDTATVNLPSTNYPYLWIAKSNTSNAYYLYFAAKEFGYYISDTDKYYVNYNDIGVKCGYYWINMDDYVNLDDMRWKYNLDTTWQANRLLHWGINYEIVWSNFNMYLCEYKESNGDYYTTNQVYHFGTIAELHNIVKGLTVTAPSQIKRGQDITIDVVATIQGVCDDACNATIWGAGENTDTSITRVEDAAAEQFILHCGLNETESVLRVEIQSINNPMVKEAVVVRVVGEYGEIIENDEDKKRKSLFLQGLTVGMKIKGNRGVI